MSFFNRNPMSGAMPPADPYDIYGVFGGGDPLGSVDLFGGAPQAPQPYQDPYSGYQDPYAGYEDPYASYQDPYAGYQDPFSDIDLFGAGRSGQQGSMFGAPMGYMPPPMPSTTAPTSGTGGPAAPAPGGGDTVYAGGTPGFDERTGQYTQQPPQGGDGGASLPPPIDRPTFFAGDKPFATRQEAIDYARNVLGNPNAVELRNPVDPAAAQQTFTFATPEQLASAQGYFGVGDKRFVDRDEASRYAAAMGTTGGPMLFSRMGEGELNVTGPQAQIDRRLTDAEQQARRAYRERSAREREEQRRLNEQRNAHWSSIIDAQKQAQQNVNPEDFYYIDTPSLGELKFASFDQAKRFLESYNTAGRENVTDVYDKSQRSNLPSQIDRIKSSAGKSLFRTGSGTDFNASAFDNREDAVKFMMERGGISRDRAERMVREYKAVGGEVSKRLNTSDIKHFRRGGPVGSFVERR